MQRNITFKNSKGQRLVGVLHMPKGNGPYPAVIVIHGFRGNHSAPFVVSLANKLEKKGYIALRFTLSGHKPSGGNYQSVVVSQFVKDIKSALNYLSTLPQVNQQLIGMIGHSMGGYVSLMSASVFPERIKTVVSISSLFDMSAVMKTYYRDKKIDQAEKDYWIISKFKVTTKHLTDKFYSDKRKYLKNIHCPVLIMHGQKDVRVSINDAYAIYKLLKGQKKMEIIKNADHNFNNKKDFNQAVDLSVEWMKEYLSN